MTSNVTIALLQALADVGNFLLPEKTLFADVGIRLSKPLSHTEFRQLLASQEEQRRIVCVDSKEDGRKWKITDNGRARLAELV